MERIHLIAFCTFLLLGVAPIAFADHDFYGIVEVVPSSRIGTWVVGGRSIEVTEQTEFDEDNGRLEVGVCAEVEMDDGLVEEIESEPLGKCNKPIE